MASDWAAELRDVPIRIPNWTVEIAFFGLLLLVFLGHSPFVPPSPIAQAGGTNPTGAGDVFRQICYLAIFGVSVLGALQKRGLGCVRAVPLMMALLLGWCLLSASWAGESGVALRRAVLEVLVVVSIFLAVDTLGWERCLALWRYLLAAILFVNFVSIPLISTAVHSGSESDVSLVGDWRGLFSHKNVAGAMCAVTAILFFFPAIEHHRWHDGAIAVLAVVFLAMTHSKSSIGILPIALLAGSVYRLSWRNPLDRAILCVVAALVIAGVATIAAVESSVITRLLEDPTEFTGRAEIWQAEFAYIRDHALLGAGFGTFAETGGVSPLHAYMGGDWLNDVSHGHNGYLQLLVTIGTVGFALALLAFFVQPLRDFWEIDPARISLKATMFAVFVFLALHNFLESDFLNDDGAPGVTLLLAIAFVRAARSERPAGTIENQSWPATRSSPL